MIKWLVKALQQIHWKCWPLISNKLKKREPLLILDVDHWRNTFLISSVPSATRCSAPRAQSRHTSSQSTSGSGTTSARSVPRVFLQSRSFKVISSKFTQKKDPTHARCVTSPSRSRVCFETTLPVTTPTCCTNATSVESSTTPGGCSVTTWRPNIRTKHRLKPRDPIDAILTSRTSFWCLRHSELWKTFSVKLVMYNCYRLWNKW